MPIVINGSGTVTGISVGGLPDGIVDTDMIAAGAVNAAKSTGLGGLTEADQWRMTEDLTGSGSYTVTNDLERVSGNAQGTVGTGMSHSSGVWTFPSTGIWQVSGSFRCSLNDGTDVAQTIQIHSTVNNGTAWVNIAEADQNLTPTGGNGHNYCTATASTLLDITDTSNQKVKFIIDPVTTNPTFYGHGDCNQTYFTFLKLAET